MKWEERGMWHEWLADCRTEFSREQSMEFRSKVERNLQFKENFDSKSSFDMQIRGD